MKRIIFIICRIKNLSTCVRYMECFLNLFILIGGLLQYCDGFCHPSHESAIGIHVSPPPEPPRDFPTHGIPPGCRRALALVPWVIHQTLTGYLFHVGNAYVSMLFSQIIPPSPSPSESKSLFFMSACVGMLRSHEKEGSSDTCCSTDELGRRCAE